MIDLMDAIAARLRTLLVGQEFPCLGAVQSMVPRVSLRSFPPRDFTPQDTSGLPDVVIYRLRQAIGFCQPDVQIGILWRLPHPTPDSSTGAENYYRLAEEGIDRADEIMGKMLVEGRRLAGWDLAGVLAAEYGINDDSDQPDNYSLAIYKITATKTR